MNQTGVVVVVVLCLKQWHSLDQIPFLFQSETDGAAVLVPVFSLVSHTHSLEYKWLFYSPTGTRVQHQNLRTNTGERWENRTGNDVWSPRSWFISESEKTFPSLLTVREEKKTTLVCLMIGCVSFHPLRCPTSLPLHVNDMWQCPLSPNTLTLASGLLLSSLLLLPL